MSRGYTLKAIIVENYFWKFINIIFLIFKSIFHVNVSVNVYGKIFNKTLNSDIFLIYLYSIILFKFTKIEFYKPFKIMTINPKNIDEVKMWNEFRGGNHTAFTQIYQNYISLLYNYSTSITPDRELIKDCLHDLFVELWKNHKNLGETTSIRYYLMASIKRKLVRHLETTQRHSQHHEAYYLENPDYTGSHEHRLVAFEEEKLLTDNLNESFRFLTKRQKEAVSLKFFQDMDTDQISNVMNINPQSVYNLIFGALKILKEHISQEKMTFA